MFYLIPLLFITSLSLAKPLRIHSVSETIVKFTNGEVGFWPKTYNKSLKRFTPRKGQIVEVSLTTSNDILRMRPIHLGLIPEEDIYTETFGAIEPTILPSYKATQKLMNTFNKSYIDGSECYDRAHIWSFEAYQNQSVMLQKIFVFFADHYIEKFKFQWWFHVAPMAKLTMKEELTERVMDARFSKYPLKIELWTNIFMRNKAQCKEVEFYTDYSEHPLEDDCYLIKSSAYFWQPRDLEDFAKSRFEKTQFIDWEIRHAYKHAFGKEL